MLNKSFTKSKIQRFQSIQKVDKKVQLTTHHGLTFDFEIRGEIAKKFVLIVG